jgi:hypothetical protein
LEITFFNRPLHGLWVPIARPPSAEALGYFHSVRFADVDNDLQQSPLRAARARCGNDLGNNYPLAALFGIAIALAKPRW